MKKKIIYILLIAFSVVVLGMVLLFDHMFSLANPVVCPEVKDITSFSIECYNDPITISELNFGGLLVYMKLAEPTRKLSLNDNPDVRPYYQITVDTEDRQYKYYIYEEYGAFYLEVSYEGIYILDGDVALLLE